MGPDAEETVGFGQKRAQHEHAAHEVRNWVRLTFDCNDRCVFCLDADTHDGRIRGRAEVKAQILDGLPQGRRAADPLRGRADDHPDFVDFVRLGHAAGYRKVQTVTNGRMFAYREFLTRAIDAGLGEITFSIHGPDAKIHDALVGVKGAFDEEIAGLRHALDDGRVIVNIDVCVNRANVKHLPEMLRRFTAMGVREFDLLQVIPFGRAYREGKDTLFYDLEQARPYLLEAFAFARQPDMHVWLNRFPVEHLEGFEELIQDPYKLGDEVRGRKEEYARWLDEGVPLSCREPDRCRHCYVRRLCDHLDGVRDATVRNLFDVVRIDTGWEARLPETFGGDPASAEKVREARRLPVFGAAPAVPRPMDLPTRVAESGARTAWMSRPTWRRRARPWTRCRRSAASPSSSRRSAGSPRRSSTVGSTVACSRSFAPAASRRPRRRWRSPRSARCSRRSTDPSPNGSRRTTRGRLASRWCSRATSSRARRSSTTSTSPRSSPRCGRASPTSTRCRSRARRRA